MAMRSWTPDQGFVNKKLVRPASVSTSLSLELCTFPSTLGSSVAADALEQLLVVEKSLQGDYFTCNEEVKTFLKDITAAVKKLEEMRKNTIEMLEIESMELSRLYFLLETVPNSMHRELEECITDARKLNLFEISQMRKKIEKMNSEVKLLNSKISDLKNINEVLGAKQAELAKQHAKYVLLLNQTLEEKANATIYINDTYTRINFEKEEIGLQKQCLQTASDLIEKHKQEYLEKKEYLAVHIKEVKQSCEERRKEAYYKRKELTRLQNKIIKMKQTVTSSSVIISDQSQEIARLQEAINIWKKKVEDMRRVCESLEEKLLFFMNHKQQLDNSSTEKKNGFVNKIQQMGEKLQKMNLENKDLRQRLNTLLKQYKTTLKEEEAVTLQKQHMAEEHQKQVSLITQKETFLAQRKLDIKRMEEGFGTLHDLNTATKEVYRKQIKLMAENREKEIQRCVINQWKIVCSKKRHARWLLKIKHSLRKIITEIEIAEEKRLRLLEETKRRRKEINRFVHQIEKIKEQLMQEEKEYIKKEKRLIKELGKYEDLIIKEIRINKVKEEELGDTLPQLQVAEEDFREKNRTLRSLHSDISAKRQEERLLSNYIFRYRKDIIRCSGNTENVKREIKHLRNLESEKNKKHFEILKNLENEIYVNDQKMHLLILENQKLREYLAYLKKQTQEYVSKQVVTVQNSGDLSWQLIAQHSQYSDLLAEFQILIKELVDAGEDTLQEIKSLVSKLQYRDEKIESISSWLLEGIGRLRRLMEEESPSLSKVDLQELGKKQKNKKVLRFSPSIHARRDRNCKLLKKQPGSPKKHRPSKCPDNRRPNDTIVKELRTDMLKVSDKKQGDILITGVQKHGRAPKSTHTACPGFQGDG
ncbi:coiled-coil domain-containing protein 175 [Apodemus sylvaticus]|uniref:coiled-coil domain-containing protein 175 n=1 Tax=Apodemus sylvaticus TaxID=10129 RepID=UPI0022442DBF|nr:coiled-coil domain-containing protein 175 [Apodemus sylvaticus]